MFPPSDPLTYKAHLDTTLCFYNYVLAPHFPSPGTRPNLIELIERERESNDPMSNQVENIVHTIRHGGLEGIDMAILQEWMRERGQLLTWKTLVNTLKSIQLANYKNMRDVKN